MNFMKDDEFLLLMVHCEDRAHGFERLHVLTSGERERLYNVGIRTAHEQPAWFRVHPSRDHYDWTYLDNIVNRNRNAGLKSLIQLPGWRCPRWIPQEWKARRKGSYYEDEALSFWNEEAQEYSDNYIKKVMEHYPYDEDVGFFFGEFQGGEGAYPPTWCLYDQSTIDAYRKDFGTSGEPDFNPETMEWFGKKVIEHYRRKTAIIYPEWQEVWNCQQWLMNEWNKGYGNFVQPEIMKLHREDYPNGVIVLLQYTYFDDSHPPSNAEYVDKLIEISGCETIVEAMFCGGLPTTTPKAIAKGFRGQIIHPASGFEKTTLQEWEINNIKNSHNLWRASKGL